LVAMATAGTEAAKTLATAQQAPSSTPVAAFAAAQDVPPPSNDVVRLMGVPEHFTFPFLLAERTGAFIRAGCPRVDFAAVPGGTGAMVAALESGEADVVVALTEGITAALVRNRLDGTGVRLRYCGQYVASPLRWMVATGASNGSLRSLEDLQGDRPLRVSVSRMGSGSHLMAFVLALREHWPLTRLTFLVHRDFRSMRRAVATGAADIFMWEWFMTQPFVAEGELRALGHIDTPWNAFGFCTTDAWLAPPGRREVLQRLAGAVFEAAAAFTSLDSANSSCESIAAHYGLALGDAHAWLGTVRYPAPLSPRADGSGGLPLDVSPLTVPAGMLEHVTRVLVQVGILPPAALTMPLEEILDAATVRVLPRAAFSAASVALGAIHPSQLPGKSAPSATSAAPAPSVRAPAAGTLSSSPASGPADIFTLRVFSSRAEAGLGASHQLLQSHSAAPILDEAPSVSSSPQPTASFHLWRHASAIRAAGGLASGSSSPGLSPLHAPSGAVAPPLAHAAEVDLGGGGGALGAFEALPPGRSVAEGSVAIAPRGTSRQAAALAAVMSHLHAFGGAAGNAGAGALGVAPQFSAAAELNRSLRLGSQPAAVPHSSSSSPYNPLALHSPAPGSKEALLAAVTQTQQFSPSGAPSTSSSPSIALSFEDGGPPHLLVQPRAHLAGSAGSAGSTAPIAVALPPSQGSSIRRPRAASWGRRAGGEVFDLG